MTEDMNLRSQQLAARAQTYIAANNFSSIAWRVDHQSSIISQGEVGHTDHHRKTPVARDAIYRIYSMTKPIVSVAALQLMEQGRLRLSDPVCSYIPEIAHCKVLGKDGSCVPLRRPMIIADLLTHRAGFSYDFQPDCAVAERYRQAQIAGNAKQSLAAMVEQLAGIPLAYQPGTHWHYSYATDVLARVLEIVAECSLNELLQDRLFTPLQMTDTGFSVSDDARHRLLPMYGARDLGQVVAEPDGPQVLTPIAIEAGYPASIGTGFARGGHGLFSTTEDYARFIRVLVDGCTADGETLLSAPMVDMMWCNRIPADQRPIAVGPKEVPGYGWNLFGRVMLDTGSAMKLSSEGEGGWAGAASTYFWVDRQRQFSGIVMAQYLGASTSLGDDMQTAAYQLLLD